MKVLPLSNRLEQYLASHNLKAKYKKQIRYLETNPAHPSLNVELLEPRGRGIYSFRIDRVYRALFIYREDLGGIEVIALTRHYQ